MRIIAQIISYLALAMTLIPSILYLNGTMKLAPVKTWMLIGAIAWFITVPLWMGRRKDSGKASQ
jgi:hypothetical protein